LAKSEILKKKRSNCFMDCFLDVKKCKIKLS
jgi:hypothetical protein